MYWAACLISIALVLWLGAERTSAYNYMMFLPDDVESVLQNLLILLRLDTLPRLTPPAWALTVELFFYACIGLGASRTRLTTLIWFAASVLYTIYVNLASLPWAYRYSLIPAASLPFATGALIHHYKDAALAAAPWLRARFAPAALIALVALNFALSRAWGTLGSSGFYLNYALHALCVLSLVDRKPAPGLSRRVDERLGELSYPIYLIHYQAGLLLVGLGVGWRRGELAFAIVALPVALGLAWLLAAAVERPIDRVRERVKRATAPA